MPDSATEQIEDTTTALLASLWIRYRPLVDERLALLDRAAASAAANTLDVDSREEAADVAHKLAGSLGMYGYDQGSRLARQLEILLDYASPDADRLGALATELRQAITSPAPHSS
ncbi:MAG: Hpt domain-containing protein [Acidobacteriota bacterium]|nr:Hpt domain-containing protein [Acidobacteriota bacterium]